MNVVYVGIIMGSDSDLSVMSEAAKVCEEFGVGFEISVCSAHRSPDKAAQYAKTAVKRGLKVIIAGAGGAAHLAGVTAALTPLPVIGVPIQFGALSGVDALYSTVGMPPGIPVATVAINSAKNAGILAMQILATAKGDLLEKLLKYKQELAETVDKRNSKLQSLGYKEYLINKNS